MIRWKLKLKGRRNVDFNQPEQLELLSFNPTRGNCLKILDSERQNEPECWSPIAMVGYLIERYEDRYKRKWGMTAEQTKERLLDMEALMKREKPEDVQVAIRLLFTPKFKWVTFPVGALFGRIFYENHLVPAVFAEKESHGGEQSEWRGGREGQGGAVKASEFFG